MLTLISRWFEPAAVSDNYTRVDYTLLWLILAIGVVLRFWGLGNVGLHGDEETMAMPAMAILETGHPYLPSGMYYSRALLNTYLMSGSAWLFGESEWAFRLPSAVVGSLAGLVAFFMGRRFLDPQFNLAFVATISLLPGMIEVSQTARMYVFFVTCMIWFAACVFRWERDQRDTSLIAALLVWMLALHFHTLAIFAAPLFIFPGLSRQSWLQFIKGIGAFVTGFVIFKLYGRWIAGKYPEAAERPPSLDEGAVQSSLDVLATTAPWVIFTSGLIVSLLGVFVILRIAKKFGWPSTLPILTFALGLIAMVLLHFHLGGILLLLGTVFWLRSPQLPRSWLIVGLALAGVIAAAHLVTLYSSGAYPGRKLIGALIGVPSVWPLLRFLEYSPAMGVLYGTFLLFGLIRFANGRKLPVHFLFFAVAVWIPLMIIGVFAWWVPPRYTQGQLPYFLLCVFAGVAYLFNELHWHRGGQRLSWGGLAALAVIASILINPMALARAVDPDYRTHPDHKGAAEFIKSLDLRPDAILIAEDVLQQTYYLGKVDYWLREISNARGYSIIRDERLVDQYTATEVLGTGADLERVLGESAGRDVFVIGSGENFVRGSRMFRGDGIQEVLDSNHLEVVYQGRDGKTMVWAFVE